MNVLELKVSRVSLVLKRFKDQCQNQTVLVATDNSTVVAYINKNPLSGDVRFPVENLGLVPSLPDNLKSHAYSRVPECDGLCTVPVEPSPMNRMVTASAGVQTDLSKVVHSSCRSMCPRLNHKVSKPQSSIGCISSPIPTCLGHRCSEHKLVGSHCLCLPSHGSPSQDDPKVQAKQLPHHSNSHRLAGDALVWDLVQLSTEIPLQLSVLTTFLKQSHNHVFQNNPQHLNLQILQSS